MHKRTLISCLLIAIFGLLACEQAGLRGSNAQRAASTATGGGDGVPDNCVQGDQIVLKLPESIQLCMDQGRLYNFSEQSCLQVTAAGFECSFDSMADQVDSIGVDSSSIKSAQNDGALLVACGEKNSGKTIVAQWYYPLSDLDRCEDENPVSRIVTACYKVHEQGDLPPLDTEEQRSAALQACLKE